jgi:hypothetical protein
MVLERTGSSCSGNNIFIKEYGGSSLLGGPLVLAEVCIRSSRAAVRGRTSKTRVKNANPIYSYQDQLDLILKSAYGILKKSYLRGFSD